MQDDDETSLPCAAGLIAATLSLMTMHTLPEPDAPTDHATLRRLVERKIVSNLLYLQQHPQLPPGLRVVAAELRERWAGVGQAAEPLPPGPQAPAGALH
jgi:hypothetical protein